MSIAAIVRWLLPFLELGMIIIRALIRALAPIAHQPA